MRRVPVRNFHSLTRLGKRATRRPPSPVSPLALLAALLWTLPAFAALSPFDQLIVGVWPEYDRPAVLAVWSGTVKPESLPLEFEIEVPEGVEEVMVAGPGGVGDSSRTIHTAVRGRRTRARVNVTSPEFQIHFAFSPFGDDEVRVASLVIGCNLPLPEFHLAVQQPLASRDFTLSVPTSGARTDEHGLTYHQARLGPVEAGGRAVVEIRYVNQTGQTSMEFLRSILESSGGEGGPGQDGRQKAVSRYRLPTYQPLIVLSLTVCVVALMITAFRKGKIFNSSKDRCVQCGASKRKADAFCSRCGAKFE